MSLRVKKFFLSLIIWFITAFAIVFIFSMFGYAIPKEGLIIMFIVFLSFRLWDLIDDYFDEKYRGDKE